MNGLPAALEEAVTFDAQGLVCAVAQQHDSGEVLMVAWMNREALVETLASGRVGYRSRSPAKLWRKGESSGQPDRTDVGQGDGGSGGDVSGGRRILKKKN